MTDGAQCVNGGLGYLPAIYPQGAPSTLRVLQVDCGEAMASRRFVAEGGECHLVWGACSGLWARFRRFIQIGRLCRQVPCRLLGVHGAVAHPEVVVSLSRRVLNYAHTVTFRYADSPLRILLKRFVGLLPCTLFWSGPVIVRIRPRREVPFAIPFEEDESLVLFSSDRQVAFLFRNREPRPYAVRKSGDMADLAAESEKHCRALSLLGWMVPAVLPGSDTAKSSFLTLEYIPEYTLINVVAKSWRSRRMVFVREALAHADFCISVYRRFAQSVPPVAESVTGEEVTTLLDGLDELVRDTPDRERLVSALQGCIGAVLPRLIQHGDFCVRNVLIAGGKRGRVLIDWEDLRERRWPLTDFALLRLSLKEAYADLFNAGLEDMDLIPELAQGFADAEDELGRLLGMDRCGIKQATFLSLACLCEQNLKKGRTGTVGRIFRELTLVAGVSA